MFDVMGMTVTTHPAGDESRWQWTESGDADAWESADFEHLQLADVRAAKRAQSSVEMTA